MAAAQRSSLLVGLLHLVACGHPLEDSIESLQAGGDQGVAAAQELLLANERSISPLVSALERTQAAAARIRLVECSRV